MTDATELYKDFEAKVIYVNHATPEDLPNLMALMNVSLNKLLLHVQTYGAKDTTKFIVVGGVWSKDWSTIIEGPEFHGTFNTFKEAYDVWKARSWWTVDTCQARFLVLSV